MMIQVLQHLQLALLQPLVALALPVGLPAWVHAVLLLARPPGQALSPCAMWHRHLWVQPLQALLLHQQTGLMVQPPAAAVRCP